MGVPLGSEPIQASYFESLSILPSEEVNFDTDVIENGLAIKHDVKRFKNTPNIHRLIKNRLRKL